MTVIQQNFVIKPLECEVFSGLDVDKLSIAANFLDHAGTLKAVKMPYSAEHLLNYVRKHYTGKKVAFAYEAGPTGYGLHDRLTEAGYPCLVVAPSMVPTAPGQKVKNNRLDSQKIAESLRGGQLRGIHVPSESYRALRHLTQMRDTFVRQSVAAKNRIKSFLLFEGIPFPPAPASSPWSGRVVRNLREIPCAPAIRFKLSHLLESLEFADRHILETMREIRRFCREDAEIERCARYLMSIPGVGFITASQFLARIGDWRLMGNARQLSSFLGLVPREHSTGETVWRGPITCAGDGRVRNKLIQCAWAAIRKDPELKEFYQRIYHRNLPSVAARKAIVAVARKLSSRIYSVLSQQRPYVVRRRTSPLLTEEETCPRERLDTSQNQEREVIS